MTRYTTRALELAAAVALGAVMASSGGDAGAQAPGPMQLEPCRLEHPYGLGSIAARCGRLAVPEDYDRPDGTRIELSVAVVPAIAARAKPDPLFLLAGGPGRRADSTRLAPLESPAEQLEDRAFSLPREPKSSPSVTQEKRIV